VDKAKILALASRIAYAIKTVGSIPSGHIYAQVMGETDLETYNTILGVLKSAKMISIAPSHMIKWIGPK
jgi:hypothetical protein